MVANVRGYDEERACAQKKEEVAGNLVCTKVTARHEGFAGDEEEGGGGVRSKATTMFWRFLGEVSVSTR